MIALGSDHGGFLLKEAIKQHLEEQGYEVKDFGSYDENPVDYPTIAVPVAKAVISGECERAILCCGTGLGMSIAANKINGIRAACCSDCYSAQLTRTHNDANVLCLGGRVIGPGLAIMMADLFLTTKFVGGRHAHRLEMLKEIEATQDLKR
ncbi:MAG: ribose 5-phosphate isomerase B [Eubacterium sp.]|nr:ribose 5-phosphate isomerase B [Eubacterium sp.]